jgi:hypothetical protein
MNRVLVTGLALGLEAKTSKSCNFDLEWLIRYPSILIWADEIIITEAIWDVVSKGMYPDQSRELTKAIRLIFELANSENIIKVINPSKIISPDLKNDIYVQIRKDRKSFTKFFPDHVTLGDSSEVPGQIFIDGVQYCTPHIWTIYAAFILASTLNAHCLFDSDVLNYCRYKFGLTNLPKEGETGRVQSFQAVFEGYLPNVTLFPGYVLSENSKCHICANEKNCRDTYLSTLEADLKEIFSWWNYDEIHQLKAVVSAIVRRREEAGGILDPNDVIREFRNEQNKIRKRVNLVFPRVRRWANITTLLSIPVVVTGVGTTNSLITVSGAGLAGLAQCAKEVVDLLSNKYSWIGFISKDAKLHQENRV